MMLNNRHIVPGACYFPISFRRNKKLYNVHSFAHQTHILLPDPMQAQYSADDLTAARSLQASTYIYTSMATFWIYDYACSLHQEWMFLLRSRRSIVKGLYVVTRYVPFLLFTGHLYMNFISNENSNKCQLLNNICSCFSLISVTCSECIFVIRTYALWNNNKIVLATMVATFLAIVISSISFAFATTATAPWRTSAIPGITGCYQSSAVVQLFIPFILLLGLEFGLMCLTLIRAIQNWRSTNGNLYAVLVKHNIFYYACGLFFSTVNILTLQLFQYGYEAMFQDFQFIVLAILATRMHLHLWHTNTHTYDSSALVCVPLSDISFAGSPT
ncbi:hypothetical protein DFJ58DRAFT_504362 [Suillus subalutaceus]|uniref:uncharacterized protein n=1 Tax=Suillus subalutaceus TaxID=48586 RepID=UPI001B87742B|nr:uncharacterized protein DFJ58DRAFT_504362 [Suillus subalutaceus]KAG1845909.1 hypothetical protein DFJ58DRAFT_504362 [Suillus subalutaceus]